MATKGEKILAAASVATLLLVTTPFVGYWSYESYLDSSITNSLDNLMQHNPHCSEKATQLTSNQILIGLRGLNPELSQDESRNKMVALRLME